jgi:HEAT repeat protein
LDRRRRHDGNQFTISSKGDERALKRLGDHDRKPVEYWGDLDALQAELSSKTSGRTRRRMLERAAIPLAKSGDPRALAFLAELVRDPASSRRVRVDAIQALIRAGPAAAPYVRNLIKDSVVDPRLPWALSEVGSPEDVQLLQPLLHRRGLWLRYNSVMALDRLDGPGARECLAQALSDRRFVVRARAIAALRKRCADLELWQAIDAARKRVPWYRLYARRHLKKWARWAAAPPSRRRPPRSRFRR